MRQPIRATLRLRRVHSTLLLHALSPQLPQGTAAFPAYRLVRWVIAATAYNAARAGRASPCRRTVERSPPNLRFRDGRFQCQLVPPVLRGNDRNCAISVVSACPQKQCQLAAHFRHRQAADRRELITYRQSQNLRAALGVRDVAVNFNLAECRLILPEAQARSQTATSMMARPIQGCCTSSCGPGRVSRSV